MQCSCLGAKTCSTRLSSSNEADSSSCDDCTGEKFIVPEVEKILPEGVKDVDTDPDPFAVSEYAESIFRNMKSREVCLLNLSSLFRISYGEILPYFIKFFLLCTTAKLVNY